MASKTVELTENYVFRPTLRDGSRGVLQVDHDTTDVSLYGSLNGENFVLIESFDAPAIKEIALTPYMMVGDGTEASRTLAELQTGQDFGNTEVYINETR